MRCCCKACIWEGACAFCLVCVGWTTAKSASGAHQFDRHASSLLFVFQRVPRALGWLFDHHQRREPLSLLHHTTCRSAVAAMLGGGGEVLSLLAHHPSQDPVCCVQTAAGAGARPRQAVVELILSNPSIAIGVYLLVRADTCCSAPLPIAASAYCLLSAVHVAQRRVKQAGDSTTLFCMFWGGWGTRGLIGPAMATGGMCSHAPAVYKCGLCRWHVPACMQFEYGRFMTAQVGRGFCCCVDFWVNPSSCCVVCVVVVVLV